jgi:hypothetical protein
MFKSVTSGSNANMWEGVFLSGSVTITEYSTMPRDELEFVDALFGRGSQVSPR